MPYDSNVDVTLRGLQGGQVCENQFEYHAETAVSGSYAADIADYVYNTVWAELKPLVCAEFTLLQIEVKTSDTFIGGGISESFILDVNEVGTNTGEPLPPNVTIRVVKVVNNSTIEPSGATPFRNGFAGFSGAAEHEQNNGLMDATSRATWQAMADELMSIGATIGGTPYSWTLGLERGELNPDKVLCSNAIVSQRLGTRNSRKR